MAARVGVRGPGPLVDHARVGVVEAGEHLIARAVDRLGVVKVVGALPLQGVAARGVGQHDCRAARPVPTVDAPHGRRDAREGVDGEKCGRGGRCVGVGDRRHGRDRCRVVDAHRRRLGGLGVADEVGGRVGDRVGPLTGHADRAGVGRLGSIRPGRSGCPRRPRGRRRSRASRSPGPWPSRSARCVRRPERSRRA